MIRKLFFASLALLALAYFTFRVALPHWFPPPVQFNRDLRPILNKNCLRCHGGVRKQAGLSFLFREEALAPGKSGLRAIVPGKPEESELMRRISHHDPELRMPAMGDPLTTEQIELFKRWIAEGAEWQEHWAYVKPQPQRVPEVRRVNWPRNEIDHFILAQIEAENLSPANAAVPTKLLRRVSLDLTGLPPSPELLAAFLRDSSTQAYERAVDALLAAPAFGERWAAMWLDLARYADTKGYESDGNREIWKYRDWLIEAFNHDMPFDQFTIAQLAGDLWPNATAEQILPTAFHRNTMNNDEGGTDDEEFRIAAVVDRVNTTWEVWMGTTMACAQCHTHPYDPFRQEEYYRFFAFFNNTADADRPDEAPTLPFYTLEKEQQRARWQAVIDSLQRVAFSAAQRRQLKQAHDSLQAIAPAKIPIMRELPADSARKTYVFVRGNFLNREKEVMRGLPMTMPPLPTNAPNNRLGLAQWLVSAENPLTARVIVNRFWEQIFGAGIVETVEDFGTQGMPPSHPELLDWLALRFANEYEWSVKRLLKAMVLSATYRQASEVSADLLARDPYNRWLARGPRVRLSSEQVRDQALAVSGLLSTKMFGPSVMPPQPPGVWQVIYNDAEWRTSAGADRYRRGLYTFWRRTSPYPAFLSFDSPTREFCVSRRIRTNTPLQALVTLNDPVYVEAAQALAARVYQKRAHGTAERVRECYEAALRRAPNTATLNTLVQLYEDTKQHYAQDVDAAVQMAGAQSSDAIELATLTIVANAVMNLDEFIVKE